MISELSQTLAKDLGKEEPNFTVKGDDVYFTSDGCELLKQVFIHLIHNSMDHGLEGAEERLAKGKLAAGSIQIESKITAEGLLIQYKDDGRGVNLDDVASKAKELGVVQDISSLSSAEKLSLMFESGVSTASQVTDISGRGVGMQAVREFIVQIGGQFNIEVDQEMEGRSMLLFSLVIPFEYFRVREYSKFPKRGNREIPLPSGGQDSLKKWILNLSDQDSRYADSTSFQ